MNKIDSTLTESDYRELHAWCAEVRATHAQLSAPFTDNDPRYDEMAQDAPGGRGQLGQFSPAELSEMYAHRATGERAPRWPLTTPGWAVETSILAGTYPEMKVQFVGKGWSAGEFTARIERLDTIFADDFVNADGTKDRLGDLHIAAAKVFVDPHGDDLAWDEAIQLATAIEDAATELRKYEEGN